MQNKILILAHDFYPMASAAAARPYGWYLHMKKYGFEPIVVTRYWRNNLTNEFDVLNNFRNTSSSIEKTEHGSIIRVPYHPNCRDRFHNKFQGKASALFRKFLSFIYSFTPFLTILDDANRGIYLESRKYLKNQKVDAIIATGGPYFLFRYASMLSEEFRIPWFADYRDLWSYYPKHGSNIINESLHKYSRRLLENYYTSKAEGIVTVTPKLVDILKTNFRNKPVFLSYNGYLRTFKKKKEKEKNKNFNHLKLAYLGSIYAYYDLDSFFSGCIQFTKIANKQLSITFIGLNFYPSQKKKIINLAQSKGIIVYFTSKVEFEHIHDKLYDYDALLLFGLENGVFICAKLFEYLQVEKPVILFARNHKIMENIIKETNAGYAAANSTELCKVLLKIDERKKNNCSTMKRKNVVKYSRENQTKFLCEFISDRLKVRNTVQ